MEIKKCLKSCWSKVFIGIIVIIGGIFLGSFYLMDEIRNSERIRDSKNIMSTAPIIVSTNIKWNDSICSIVLDELELASVIYKNSNIIPHESLLLVDSLSYSQLKEYAIIPQSYVDSIYRKEGVNGLLSTFFDGQWFNTHCNELSLLEQRYIVYILLKCGFGLTRDCESGYLYISKGVTPQE